MIDGFRADVEHGRNSALAYMTQSGQDTAEFRKQLLAQFSENVYDELQMAELMRGSSPRLYTARKRKSEHEIQSGHSVFLQGWPDGSLGPLGN